VVRAVGHRGGVDVDCATLTAMRLANGMPKTPAVVWPVLQCQSQSVETLRADQHRREVWVSIHFPTLLRRGQRIPSEATGQHTFRGESVMCARMSAANTERTIADIRCKLPLKSLRTLVDGI